MGIAGGPLILWLLYRAFFRTAGHTEERRFWIVMIPVCVILGIASTGERDPRGVAHLTLFPLQLVGLSFLAAAFPWRRKVLWLILAGCAVDFCGGVLLHAYVQNLENSPGRTVYAGLNATGGKPNDTRAAWYSVGGLAWENWYLKHQYLLNVEALARLDHGPSAHASVGRIQIEQSLTNNDSCWHGWYARNGGSLQFLGDHFSGQAPWCISAQMSALILLLASVIRSVIKKNLLMLARPPNTVA